MRATVTSCIGGQEERFAVHVLPIKRHPYFVYKSMSEFITFWNRIVKIAQDEQTESLKHGDLLAKWLSNFVEQCGFKSIAEGIQVEGKETMMLLNRILSSLTRRLSALYMENTVLPRGFSYVDQELAHLIQDFLEFPQQCDMTRLNKRHFDECRPKDAESVKRKVASHMFPDRCAESAITSKPRTFSFVGSNDFLFPVMHNFDQPVLAKAPARSRAFAGVGFALM